MADATYPLGGQGNRQEQGGKSWVIGSTGSLTFESGGQLTGSPAVPSGSELNFDSGSAISLDDGAQLTVPVTVKSTSTGTITNFGITTLGSTSNNAYTLAAPDRSGLRKTLIYTVSGASGTCSITTASTNSYIRSSTAVAGDTHAITFTEAGDWAELVSVSTAEWRVLGNSGGTVS